MSDSDNDISQISLEEAQDQLPQLVDRAVRGETVIIARAGQPLAKVMAAGPSIRRPQRIGFMKGNISVPYDFDSMGKESVNQLFSGEG